MHSKQSFFKAFLFASLVFSFSCNLLGMEEHSANPGPSFDTAKASFEQMYKVEQPSPWREAGKFVGGAASMVFGGYLAKEGLKEVKMPDMSWTVEGIKHGASALKNQFGQLDSNTQRMIGGGIALGAAGIGLWAWIKPGKLKKNQKEKLFNSAKKKAFEEVEDQRYNKTVTIDTTKLESTIEYIDNYNNTDAVSFDNTQKKEIQKAISDFANQKNYPVNISHRKIQSFVATLNHQKNKSFFHWLFTKDSPWTHTMSDVIRINLVHKYALEELKSDNFDSKNMKPWLYAHYLATQGATTDNKTTELKFDFNNKSLFNATIKEDINIATFNGLNNIQSLHKKLKVFWGKKIGKTYNTLFKRSSDGYSFDVLQPKPNLQRNLASVVGEMFTLAQQKLYQYNILAYKNLKKIDHIKAVTEQKLHKNVGWAHLFGLRKEIFSINSEMKKYKNFNEYALQKLTEYKIEDSNDDHEDEEGREEDSKRTEEKKDTRKPCVVIKMGSRDYVVVKTGKNNYTLNTYDTVALQDGRKFTLNPVRFKLEGSDILSKVKEAIQKISKEFTSNQLREIDSNTYAVYQLLAEKKKSSTTNRTINLQGRTYQLAPTSDSIKIQCCDINIGTVSKTGIEELDMFKSGISQVRDEVVVASTIVENIEKVTKNYEEKAKQIRPKVEDAISQLFKQYLSIKVDETIEDEHKIDSNYTLEYKLSPEKKMTMYSMDWQTAVSVNLIISNSISNLLASIVGDSSYIGTKEFLWNKERVNEKGIVDKITAKIVAIQMATEAKSDKEEESNDK